MESDARVQTDSRHVTSKAADSQPFLTRSNIFFTSKAMYVTWGVHTQLRSRPQYPPPIWF